MDSQRFSQRLLVVNRGKLAIAALAAVVGIPQAIAHAASATQPSSTSRPSTSSLAPSAAEQLYPSVHWFAAWNDQATAKDPSNALSGQTINSGTANGKTPSHTAASGTIPLHIKTEKAPLLVQPSWTYRPSDNANATSYIFADFETNRNSLHTVSSWLTVPIRTSPSSPNSSFSEYAGASQKNMVESVSSHPGTLFLTKAQYDIVKVSMANLVLYPSGNSVGAELADAARKGNLHSGLTLQPATSPDTIASGNKNIDAGSIMETNLYHKPASWLLKSDNWANLSLAASRANDPAKGVQFASIADIPQGSLHGTQELTLRNLNSQILHYRLHGAYAGNDSYDVDAAIADSGVASAVAKCGRQSMSIGFNPTGDPSSDLETGESGDVSSSIWAGNYALKMQSREAWENHREPINRPSSYQTVNVYEVLASRGTGSIPPVYLSEDNGPNDSQALAESGMRHVLTFDPANTREYKGVSVTNADSTKCIWIMNDNYQIFANAQHAEMKMPEPTLFSTLAAAGSMALLCRRRRRRAAI